MTPNQCSDDIYKEGESSVDKSIEGNIFFFENASELFEINNLEQGNVIEICSSNKIQIDNPNDCEKLSSCSTDKMVRIKFIRNVYLIISLQLTIIFGVCLTFYFVEPIRHWIATSRSGFILYILA